MGVGGVGGTTLNGYERWRKAREEMEREMSMMSLQSEKERETNKEGDVRLYLERERKKGLLLPLEAGGVKGRGVLTAMKACSRRISKLAAAISCSRRFWSTRSSDFATSTWMGGWMRDV